MYTVDIPASYNVDFNPPYFVVSGDGYEYSLSFDDVSKVYTYKLNNNDSYNCNAKTILHDSSNQKFIRADFLNAQNMLTRDLTNRIFAMQPYNNKEYPQISDKAKDSAHTIVTGKQIGRAHV